MPRSATFIEALEAPDLLKRAFKPYRGQKRLLVPVLNDETLALKLLVCGRQCGKTETVSARTAAEPWRASVQGKVPPGGIRHILLASADEAASRELLQRVRRHLEACPLASSLLAEPEATRIDLHMGNEVIRYEALAGRPDAAVGKTASLVWIDEAASRRGGGEQFGLRELIAAAQPTLAHFGDHGHMIVSGTPRSTTDDFAELIHDVEAGHIPDSKLVKAATWEVRDTLGQKFLARARAAIGDADFRRAYEAELIDDAGGNAFFPMKEISFDNHCPTGSDVKGWRASLDLSLGLEDNLACALLGESATEPGVLLVCPTPKM